MLVNVVHLAVWIEARSAELRVVCNRLGEVVDLAILRDAADKLRVRAVLAEEDVLGVRDDGDVVWVLERGALERDVYQRERLAAGIVLPNLAEIRWAALGAGEKTFAPSPASETHMPSSRSK